jgi:hypothetical protein
MSYLFKENVATCRDNDKGYLYALTDGTEPATWDMIDHNYHDSKFPTSKYVVYIGMSSNPIERFSQHRQTKDKNLGMTVFAKTETDFPEVELQAMENQAILNYCLANGDYPKYQKGAKKFSGA